MKTFYLLLLLVAASVLATSCSKKGDTGPAGNANVTLYNFGSKTFTATTEYPLSISQGKIDSSVVLAYYNPSGEVESAWYNVPGNGPVNLYVTRGLFYQANPTTYSYKVFLHNPSGSSYAGSVTFRKFRLFVIPATTLITGRVANPEARAEINHQTYTESELKAMPYRQVCSLLGVTP